MSIEKIYNIETGETIEVELSKERVASIAAYQVKVDAEVNAKEALEAKKQEVLTKLGLTAEEATALLA